MLTHTTGTHSCAGIFVNTYTHSSISKCNCVNISMRRWCQTPSLSSFWRRLLLSPLFTPPARSLRTLLLLFVRCVAGRRVCEIYVICGGRLHNLRVCINACYSLCVYVWLAPTLSLSLSLCWGGPLALVFHFNLHENLKLCLHFCLHYMRKTTQNKPEKHTTEPKTENREQNIT